MRCDMYNYISSFGNLILCMAPTLLFTLDDEDKIMYLILVNGTHFDEHKS